MFGGRSMADFFNQTSVQAVLGVTALLIAIFIGFRVVWSLRPAITKDHTGTEDWVTNFEEMHSVGDISETEFRTIKSVLGKKQRDSLGKNG